MAKAILNGQEIFGNVHIGQGGGETAPIFDTTLLYDSNGDYTPAASIALSEDYHNFDFLKFSIYRDTSTTPTYAGEFIVSPTEFDELCNNAGKYLGFFPLYNSTNYGYCITPTNGTTLTRRWYREVSISKIEGLKCSNMTVSTTVLYTATAGTATSTMSDDVRDYDYISICSGSGVDEVGQALLRMAGNSLKCDGVFICGHGYSNSSAGLWMSIDGVNFYRYGSASLYTAVGYKFEED